MAVSLKSTCATTRDATRVLPCARCIEWTLRTHCRGYQWDEKPRMEAADEMGLEIWVCEGLVVMLLTETCHRIAVPSSVKGSKKSNAW